MDKLVVGVHEQNKASKQIHKTQKKKPVKVVYISNPMKVNTSASQFRALVQELTGRDADDVPAPAFLQHSNVNHQEQLVDEEEHKEVLQIDQVEEELQDAVLRVKNEEKVSLPMSTPHLATGSDLLLSLQDINGYFSPSNFWYESVFMSDGSTV